jgi:uncharacterized protein (DUF433 family)
MDADRLTVRIQSNSATFAGKPTVRDTRVAVEHVLAMLADGATPEQILQEYPWLQAEDIRACLVYAWRLVSQEDIEGIPQTSVS